jgi:hypothetical protein
MSSRRNRKEREREVRGAPEYWGSDVCNSDISLLYRYPGIVYSGDKDKIKIK